MTTTHYMTGMDMAIRRVKEYAADMVHDCEDYPEYYDRYVANEDEVGFDIWVEKIIQEKFSTNVPAMIHAWESIYDWTNDAHPTCIGKSIRYIVEILTKRYETYLIDSECYTDYGRLQMLFAYVYITEHKDIIKDLLFTKFKKRQIYIETQLCKIIK